MLSAIKLAHHAQLEPFRTHTANRLVAVVLSFLQLQMLEPARSQNASVWLDTPGTLHNLIKLHHARLASQEATRQSWAPHHVYFVESESTPM